MPDARENSASGTNRTSVPGDTDVRMNILEIVRP